MKNFLITLIIIASFKFSNAQTYSSLPFSDNLTSGSLGSHWSISDAQGIGTASVANLSGGWPNFGTCSGATCSNVGATSGNGLIVYNSSAPTGSNQINMDLHLNLNGAGAVELSQAIVDWRSGWDSLQIYLSNDGGANFTYATTVKLWLAPHSDGFWNELTFDISSLATATGVSFSSTYVVRYATFLQYVGSSSSPKSWPNQSVYFDNFKGTDLAPLPVEMVYFSGVISDYGTTLNWGTAAEINNSHFEVQRSLNGTVWETVGRIEGSGNSTEGNDYEFFDDLDIGDQLFFRLKQVDYDGTYKYSNTITFDKGNDNVEMSVMKNGSEPVIAVNGMTEGEINILSMSGKAVWSKKIIEGYLLDLSFLPNGNYIALVNTDKGVVSEKITVIK